jgi:Flp pilus assembly protein TadD/TolA-binding protein
MMKKGIIVTVTVLLACTSYGQSLEQAQKMMYYERFKSAITMLDGLVKADAKNADAAYWLGQAYLTMPKPDMAKAKTVFEQALQSNPGNGLLTAAMGNIDLQENRAGDATAKFTAASAAAGKDANILLAVARANIDAKTGNYQYAIETINKALALKSVNKATAYILMGNAYRKLIDGGNADKNYRNALDADPKNALAYVRLGKIYQTQRNDEVMLDNYNKSVEVDPAFAPGYLELYNHFSYRDVNKAKEYLDKYIANSDADCNTDLFAADYLFRSGKYAEAITRSGELAAGNCGKEIGTRLKMLNAFCYERLGDSVNAKKNIDEFMQVEEPAKILGSDYEMAAKVTAKFPGSELKAIEYINRAYETDSAGRLGYLIQLVDLYKKTGNADAVAATWDRLVVVKPRPSNVDMYNRAMAHMAIKHYTLADSLWQQYKDKYPDQVYGYTYRIKCNEAQDTSMALGLAVPHYENMVAFAQRDTVKYKNQLVSALYKLVVYYGNIKKDKPKSIEYLTQYLLYDPGNEEARKALQKMKGG